MRYLILTAAILLMSIAALGQSGGSFTIEKSVIGSGGGMSAAPGFSLTGTIGQPAVGSMSAAGFSIEGGFWTTSSPSAPFASVSGQVMGDGGRFVKNSTVRITGGVTDRTISSGRYGRFTFSDLPTGITYVIQVTSRRFSYAPVLVEVNNNVTGLIIQPQ